MLWYRNDQPPENVRLLGMLIQKKAHNRLCGNNQTERPKRVPKRVGKEAQMRGIQFYSILVLVEWYPEYNTHLES